MGQCAKHEVKFATGYVSKIKDAIVTRCLSWLRFGFTILRWLSDPFKRIPRRILAYVRASSIQCTPMSRILLHSAGSHRIICTSCVSNLVSGTMAISRRLSVTDYTQDVQVVISSMCCASCRLETDTSVVSVGIWASLLPSTPHNNMPFSSVPFSS